MDMVQHILKGCQRILETVCNVLEKGMTFQEFEEELWKTMHGVGREILKAILEAKDQEWTSPKKVEALLSYLNSPSLSNSSFLLYPNTE